VRKIANLVHDHFDTLQPLGTHQGQRIKKIVELAQADWQTLATDITIEVDANNEVISRLKSLTVGPFRGFSRQEIFDLDS